MWLLSHAGVPYIDGNGTCRNEFHRTQHDVFLDVCGHVWKYIVINEVVIMYYLRVIQTRNMLILSHAGTIDGRFFFFIRMSIPELILPVLRQSVLWRL